MDSLNGVVIGRKFERDIDLLLAEEFAVSPDFSRWFLSKTKGFADAEAQVDEVYVSKIDSTGESDLVVIFKRLDTQRCFAMLIEDKIDAPLQPDQEHRYRLRAAQGMQRTAAAYDEAEVILCSPEAYLDAHPEAATFDSFVSYEQIAAFFDARVPMTPRDVYRREFIATASKKSINAWKPIYDDVTDSFWQSVFNLAISEYPEIEMKYFRYAAGTNWVMFRPYDFPTAPKYVRVDLKGKPGFVDLTFPYTTARDMQPRIKSILENNMTVHQTGKATAIRILVDPILPGDFEAQESRIRIALHSAVELITFFLRNRSALLNAAELSTPNG
jgi:hypothetical protein